MSPTEKLRAMLDERGVGYDWTDRLREVPSYQSVIWWFNTADRAEFREYHDGSTQLLICSSKTHLTPAQAIAATLGAGTCYIEHYDTDILDGERYYRCSACHTLSIRFHHLYCPNCGRRIVKEEA